MTITVDPVNDAPVLGNVPGTVAYTPGSGPQMISNAITVADVDSANLASAKITITDGIIGDNLAADVAGTSITATFNAGTHTLMLTGSDTLAHYQQVLDSITFNSNSANPSRTVAWQLDDGSGVNNLSAPQATILHLHTLDLDASTGGYDYGNTYTEHTSGVPIAAGNVTITDNDTGTMSEAIITIRNAQPNDLLSISGVLPSGISANFAYDSASGSGTLTLSGSSSTASYEAALTQVVFLVNGNITNASNRDITVSVTDNLGTPVTTNVAHTTITLIDLNDAPVLDTAGGSLSFVEGSDFQPKLIDAALTLVDDSYNMTGATVTITKNFTAGEDVLGFGDAAVTSGIYQGAITWNYNASTGVMSLSGPAPKATYEAAFRATTYFNSSSTPSGETRGVSFQVTDDGGLTSNAPTAPVAVTPLIEYNANKDAPVVIESHLGEPDPAINLTHAEISIGTGFSNGDALNFTNQNGITGSYNKTTGVLTLTGAASLADYQTALATITFSSHSVTPGVRTINWSVTDGIHDLTFNAPQATRVSVQGQIVGTVPRNEPSLQPPPPGFAPVDRSEPTVDRVTIGGNDFIGNDFIGNDTPAISFVRASVIQPDISSSVDGASVFAAQVSLLDLLAPLGGKADAITAKQANGDPLPDWLHFDPNTGMFSGSIPSGATGTITLQIIARDSRGHEAISTFTIDLSDHTIIDKHSWNTPSQPDFGHDPWSPESQSRRHVSVEPAHDAGEHLERFAWHRRADRNGALPVEIMQAPPLGRAGLSDQLKSAGWRGMHAQRMSLLENLRQHIATRQ
jgi:hypothetical protein